MVDRVKKVFINMPILWKNVYGCLMTMIIFDLLECIPNINDSYLLLFSLSILECWGIYQCGNKIFLNHYKFYAIRSICVFYMAFSLSGIWLFWDKTTFVFSLDKLLIFGLVILWCIPICLGCWEWIYSYERRSKEENNNKKIVCVIAGFLFIPFSCYLIAYNPIITSTDISSQLWQILHGEYYAHSLLHTLFIEKIWGITGTLSGVAMLQIVLFVLVIIIADQSLNLWRFGNKRWIFYAAMGLCFPLNGLMLANIWKDTIFTIFLLLLGIVCCKFSLDDYAREKSIWNIFLCVSIIMIWLIRLNGIIAITLTIMWILFTVVKEKKINWKSFIAIGVALGFILLVYPQIENKYNFRENDEQRITIRLMHTMASEIATHGFENLDKETQQIFEAFCTEEEWINNYDPFNTDAYTFETPNWLGGISAVKGMKQIELFTQFFLRDPFSMILARLCGSEIMWNIFPAEGSFNYIYDRDITEDFQNIFNINRKENGLKIFIDKIYDDITKSPILNAFFFRQGFWMNILLIFTCYCVMTRNKVGWFALPIWGNIASLFISMGCQHARYVWFICVATYLFTLIVICNPIARGDKDEAGNINVF